MYQMNTTGVMSWLGLKLKGDKWIWIAVILLSLIGVLVVYTSTMPLALKDKGGNTESFLIKHSFILIASLVLMYIVHLFDYRVFGNLSMIFLILTVPLLVFAMFQSAGVEGDASGENRWIKPLGFSVQPSELAKVAVMIYLARYLSERQGVITDFKKGFLPVIIWITLICGLIALSNLSTAMLIFACSILLIFVSGVKIKYLMGLVLIGILGLTLLFNFAERGKTWKKRLETYATQFSSASDEKNKSSALDENYQVLQSQIAIYEGGLLGKGIGKGSQRGYLPSASMDFIFAIIVEELGIVGGLVVLGLYLLLLFRAMAIVTVSKTFGALLAAGLAFLLTMQALINMGVTVGVLPVTGQPLPLISLGGTNMIFTAIYLGIILSVSRHYLENNGKEVLVAA